jgi:hypothetical protein
MHARVQEEAKVARTIHTQPAPHARSQEEAKVAALSERLQEMGVDVEELLLGIKSEGGGES